ncbi:hypothetical protein H1W37_01755 [Stappia taiwanensis]|uniref:Uncharacterized protein n=1 Tax=Stappia taiwanensis TaxID=992267 RepID=A0A838XJV2_9HYPH|nr:hypothetical protein [Stappia taiwanensis]MBA4610362.1 hypothetical protein [Stappia taiwanensis]GGE78983.1 hypothetical protein GCM10007285_03520 [Stappia taiwanensis]
MFQTDIKRLAPVAMAGGLATLLSFGAEAFDVKAIGSVTATIDEASYEGETLLVSDDQSATATFRSFGPVNQISIQAHAKANENKTQNILNIEFSVMGKGAAATVTNASVSWWPEGMNGEFFVAGDEGGTARVTLETFVLDASPNASGTFEAEVCAKESFSAEADLAKCLPIKGTFQTSLAEGK